MPSFRYESTGWVAWSIVRAMLILATSEITPGINGLEFVVDQGPAPTLIPRDAQHEYVFAAASSEP